MRRGCFLEGGEQCQLEATDAASQQGKTWGCMPKRILTSPDHRTSSELIHPQLLGLLCSVIYCSPSVIAFLELLMADISDAIRPQITCEMKSGFSCWDMQYPHCLSVSLYAVHASTGKDNGAGITSQAKYSSVFFCGRKRNIFTPESCKIQSGCQIYAEPAPLPGQSPAVSDQWLLLHQDNNKKIFDQQRLGVRLCSPGQ